MTQEDTNDSTNNEYFVKGRELARQAESLRLAISEANADFVGWEQGLYNKNELTELHPLYRHIIESSQTGRIMNVKDGLDAAEEVMILDLSGQRQRLVELDPDIGRFENLQELILDDQREIYHLPETLFSLTKLERISARNCRPALLDDLVKLPALKWLDLSGMHLDDAGGSSSVYKLQKIAAMKQLQTLYMNSCQISSLPDEFTALHQLKRLSLDYNQLQAIPPVLYSLGQLVFLSIKNNPLSAIPSELLQLSKLKEFYAAGMKAAEDQKAACDKLMWEKLVACPDFLTDYYDPQPVPCAFLPKIEQSLERLGVRKKEKFPDRETWMWINDESQYVVPLPLVQLIFGYDWQDCAFKFNAEGKKTYQYKENDEPIIVIGADWMDAGNEFWFGQYPCLCVGEISLRRKKFKLLSDISHANVHGSKVYNPHVIAPWPYARGTLAKDFIKFLSFLQPAPPVEKSSKKKAKVETQEQTDKEFSKVIQAFVDAMKEETGTVQEEKLHTFNKLCNAFFKKHPEASLASIASGLTQVGVPYEQAIGDVTWARTFGTK